MQLPLHVGEVRVPLARQRVDVLLHFLHLRDEALQIAVVLLLGHLQLLPCAVVLLGQLVHLVGLLHLPQLLHQLLFVLVELGAAAAIAASPVASVAASGSAALAVAVADLTWEGDVGASRSSRSFTISDVDRSGPGGPPADASHAPVGVFAVGGGGLLVLTTLLAHVVLQYGDDVVLVLVPGQLDGGLALVGAPSVCPGAEFAQLLDAVDVAGAGGVVERRAAPVVDGVGVRTVVQEELDDLEVAVEAGQMEGSEVVLRADGVDVLAVRHALDDVVEVARASGLNDVVGHVVHSQRLVVKHYWHCQFFGGKVEKKRELLIFCVLQKMALKVQPAKLSPDIKLFQ